MTYITGIMPATVRIDPDFLPECLSPSRMDEGRSHRTFEKLCAHTRPGQGQVRIRGGLPWPVNLKTSTSDYCENRDDHRYPLASQHLDGTFHRITRQYS